MLNDTLRSDINSKECLTCAHYWLCKNPAKRLNKACDSYASNKMPITALSHDSSIDKSKSELKQKRSLEDVFERLLDDEESMLNNNNDDYLDLDGGDLKLPENDFPLAKNLYEFVFSKKFLNLGQSGLYARQFGIGINLFMEYCPKCSDIPYVLDNFQVKDEIKNIFKKVVLFEHGVCPKCKTSKDKLLDDQKYWEHYELAALCGQRSGKSLMAAIFSTYVLHRFLKLSSVSSAYDIAKPTVILGTFVAIDKAQIMDSTWSYLVNIIKGSPWFIEYCNMLKSEGRRIGRKLVDIDKVETLEFLHKNIKLNMAAPKPASLRGRTGFIGVIDEIGFLKVKDGQGRVITAEEVYAALNNRMATLTTAYENRRHQYNGLPAPLFMNISSPCHIKDKIYTLVKGINEQNLEYAQEEEGDKRVLRRYAVHYATWEVNPMFSRDSAYIASKFKSEPKEAERDFGAKPPLSENSFIDNIEQLIASSNNEKESLININYEFDVKDSTYKLIFKDNLLTKKDYPRVLAMDLGYNNNSTALSLGYFDITENKMKVEALLEIIPTKGAEIKFTQLLQDVIIPIVKRYNVRLTMSDRWQSISIMQEIEDKTESKTLKYSLKYGDFLLFKSDLLSQRIEYPKIEDKNLITPTPRNEYPKEYFNKPISHFVYQCLTVVDERDVTVKKGEKTTDDLFRSVVLLHYCLNNLELRKKMEDSSTLKKLPEGSVVHVQSMKGGILSSQNSSTKYSASCVVVV